MISALTAKVMSPMTSTCWPFVAGLPVDVVGEDHGAAAHLDEHQGNHAGQDPQQQGAGGSQSRPQARSGEGRGRLDLPTAELDLNGRPAHDQSATRPIPERTLPIGVDDLVDDLDE